MSETQEKAGKLKVKKPKKLVQKDEPIKVDLSKPVEKTEELKEKTDAVQTQETNDSNVVIKKPEDSGDSKKVAEEVRPTEEEVKPIIEEIIEEKPEEEEVIEIGEKMENQEDLYL